MVWNIGNDTITSWTKYLRPVAGRLRIRMIWDEAKEKPLTDLETYRAYQELTVASYKCVLRALTILDGMDAEELDTIPEYSREKILHTREILLSFITDNL